jgi:arginine/lysine/ornithine decarboxylase
MLGLGSQAADIDLALAAIKDFVSAYELTSSGQNFATSRPNGNASTPMRPYKFVAPPFEPVLPPHQAMLLPHETVPLNQALGRVAAQCLSPCPPGIPILIPGQKITEEVLELISDRTIVVIAQ